MTTWDEAHDEALALTNADDADEMTDYYDAEIDSGPGVLPGADESWPEHLRRAAVGTVDPLARAWAVMLGAEPRQLSMDWTVGAEVADVPDPEGRIS